MSSPVVCPVCSRVFTNAPSPACPQCGWTPAVDNRRTTLMSPQQQATIARLALTQVEPPSAAPLELPPEPTTRPLELPADEREARLTEPQRAAVSGPDFVAVTPLALPAVDPPADEGPRLELPPDPDEIATVPSLSRAARRAPQPLAEPSTEPDARAVSRAFAPSVPRSVSPPATPVASTAFETTELEAHVRWGAVALGPLSALLIVDLFTAGRPLVPIGVVGLQALLCTITAVALLRRSRVAWPGLGLLLASLVWSALRPAVDAWSLAATLTLAFGLVALAWPGASTGRFVAGVLASLVGLAVATPDLLDGVGDERVGGAARDRSRRLVGERAPSQVVDQRSGIQFGAGTLALHATQVPGRFVEPRSGVIVLAEALPRNLSFDRAIEAAGVALVGAGLADVTVDPPRADEAAAFDVASTVGFRARVGRARVTGVIRVGETGPEAFLLAAWARSSRAATLGPPLERLIATMRRDPPARPTFESPQARALAERSVAQVQNTSTWAVRVVIGGKGAVLVPSALVQDATDLPLLIGGVGARLPLGARRVVAGVSVVPSGLTGEAAPLRAFAQAPRTSTRLVRGPGWSGGWVSSEPGESRRAVDLQSQLTGPAFDVSGALVGVVTESEGVRELVTMEALAPVLAEVLGSVPMLAPAPTEAAPLFVPHTDTEGVEPSVEQRVREGVVIIQTPSGPVAGVVVTRATRGWVLAVPRGALSPDARGVTARLSTAPEAEGRAAEVVRFTSNVALLVMEANALDALSPLPAVDARLGGGRRIAFGYRLDPATGLPTLRGQSGELVEGAFEGDPGAPVSAGPVVTSDGRLAGLRLMDGVTVVPASSLLELGVAGVRDAVWRISFEPTGTCQLAATVELEDPLGDATLVALRLEPGEAPPRGVGPPPRLKAARLTDTSPKDGEARVLFTLPCFTTAMQLQVEVASQGQTRATWPQTIRPPDDLPWVVRGRSNGSPGAGPPRNTLAAELWDTPPRATMKHPCGTAPQLCERACAVDDLDACTFDGRHALATKEFSRAVAVLDAACGRGEVEACVLLEWAAAEKKGARVRSKPDEVLRPWCTAGVARACTALDVAGWRRSVAPAKERCLDSPKACRPFAELLLAGPRLDVDLTRALGALKQACTMSDEMACGLYARTVIQLDREDPGTVMALLDRACAVGDRPSCTLRAMNPGLGLTMPRSPQIANAWLQEACAKGATDACALVLR
jgi:TPR repeat protein